MMCDLVSAKIQVGDNKIDSLYVELYTFVERKFIAVHDVNRDKDSSSSVSKFPSSSISSLPSRDR